MIYHKPLNDDFLDYGIQKINFSQLEFPSKQPHQYIVRPVEEIFTSAGLDFFKDKGIKLRSTTRIFKKFANNLWGPTHVDSLQQDDAAFNFVVGGTGLMEWVTVEGYKASDFSLSRLITIKIDSKIEIHDSWSGQCALVRVGFPHRIRSGPDDRYCISVRPTEDHLFSVLLNLV